MGMTRADALEYLDRKGKLSPRKEITKGDEQEIKKVMKEGKIYGDPLVVLKG